MMKTRQTSRRQFLRHGTVAAGAWALADRNTPQIDPWPDVGPVEDLMREHGVLRRVLLIFEEAACRIDGGRELPTGTVNDAADVVRRFINEYHEQLEEIYLFPRFEKARRQTDLVKVLLRQHRASQDLTESILHVTGAAVFKMPENRRQLARLLRQFLWLYRPHAAREDTVLFPAFRDLVSCREYRQMGERFEEREHDLFGADGFGRMVDRVAGIEKTLGLYDINQFTPPGT